MLCHSRDIIEKKHLTNSSTVQALCDCVFACDCVRVVWVYCVCALCLSVLYGRMPTVSPAPRDTHNFYNIYVSNLCIYVSMYKNIHVHTHTHQLLCSSVHV